MANKFITASVTARNQCKTTNANALKENIIRSLQDVRKMAEEVETAKGG